MGAFLRTTIVCLAAASFAALALVGDGLHGVPGFEHALVIKQGCCAGAGCAPAPRTLVGCGAWHGHHAAGDDGATGQPDAPHEPACPSQEHACPICRLLAQAKSPAAASEIPPPAEAIPQQADTFSPLCSLSPGRAFDARGPPSEA